MKSFLPDRFRPNRHNRSVQVHIPQSIPVMRTAIQDAAKANLSALLQGKPPLPLGPDLLVALFPATAPDAEALSDLAAPLAGNLVRLMMTTPDQLGIMAQPGTGFGADMLLPVLLQNALTDGAFRHDIAEICRLFLCERVLFHPGDPPQALFSAAGMALLITSQDAHGQALGPRAGRLRAAALALRDLGTPLNPWDQWLVRRMSDTATWVVAEDLAALPWVRWRHGDAPDDDMTEFDRLPGSWVRILDLVP